MLSRIGSSHMYIAILRLTCLCHGLDSVHKCQLKTPEALKCPLNAWGRGDKSKVYDYFLTNVSEFKQLNQLPVPLNFEEDMDVDQSVIY